MKLKFTISQYCCAQVDVEIADDLSKITTEFTGQRPKSICQVTVVNPPTPNPFASDVQRMIVLMVERQLAGHMLEEVEKAMTKLAAESEQAEFQEADTGVKVSELHPETEAEVKKKSHLN